jgi:hypothetical protein
VIGTHADHNKSPAAAGLFHAGKGFLWWERLSSRDQFSSGKSRLESRSHKDSEG